MHGECVCDPSTPSFHKTHTTAQVSGQSAPQIFLNLTDKCADMDPFRSRTGGITQLSYLRPNARQTSGLEAVYKKPLFAFTFTSSLQSCFPSRPPFLLSLGILVAPSNISCHFCILDLIAFPIFLEPWPVLPEPPANAQTFVRQLFLPLLPLRCLSLRVLPCLTTP